MKLNLVFLLIIAIGIFIPGCVKKEEPKEEIKLSFEPKILVLETQKGWEVNVFMTLPTPCHRVEYVGKQQKGNEYYFDFLYEEPRNPCAQVITNYNHTINLGEMKKGDYRIILRFNGEIVKKVNLKVS
jgi:hypothetical protein